MSTAVDTTNSNSGATAGLPYAGSRLSSLVARLGWDRVLGGFEQVLASIISMGGLIVFSRLLNVDDFGIVGAALGIALIGQFIHDALCASPFVIACPDPRRDRAGLGAWMLWHFVVMAGFLAILLALGMALAWTEAPVAYELLLSTMILIGATLYSHSRRLHYHWASFRALLVQTLLYGLCYAAGIWIVWSNGWMSPLSASLIIAAAYGLPGLVYTVQNCLRADFTWRFISSIRQSKALVTEIGAGAVVWQSSYAAALLSLTLFASPAAVAIFTATRTLERPVALIISTMLDVDTSVAVRRLAQAGVRGLEHVVRNAGIVILVLAGLPIALMLLFPEAILLLVYGSAYSGATLELQLRILVLIPLIATAPFILGLTVLRDTAYLLRINLLGLLAGVGFLAIVLAMGRLDAAAANASLLIMQLVAVPFLILRYRRKVADLRAQEAAS